MEKWTSPTRRYALLFASSWVTSRNNSLIPTQYEHPICKAVYNAYRWHCRSMVVLEKENPGKRTEYHRAYKNINSSISFTLLHSPWLKATAEVNVWLFSILSHRSPNKYDQRPTLSTAWLSKNVTNFPRKTGSSSKKIEKHWPRHYSDLGRLRARSSVITHLVTTIKSRADERG